MTVTVMRDTIVCPKCGNRRIVTYRQRRRSQNKGGILCSPCRGGGDTRSYTDGDIRFWLRRYGVQIPAGVPVRDFIAAGGAPPELIQLAQSVYPDAIVTT